MLRFATQLVEHTAVYMSLLLGRRWGAPAAEVTRMGENAVPHSSFTYVMTSSKVGPSLSSSLYAGTMTDNDLEGGWKMEGVGT